MGIVDWDPVIAMSFGVWSVNWAGVVRTSVGLPWTRTVVSPICPQHRHTCVRNNPSPISLGGTTAAVRQVGGFLTGFLTL